MGWLAIDAGTSVIKVVVFNDNGTEGTIARETSTVLRPEPGWSEQNMHGVWDAVVSTVREAVRSAEEPIRGIVSTAQGDGCWLVDAAGEPSGNAILWNDGRAAGLVREWHGEGLVEASFRASGSVTYSGLSNAILRWLMQYQPERLARSRWVLTCNGWLISRMTGHFVADLSDGANPFGDLERRTYTDATLARYGLEGEAYRLPPLVGGSDAVFTLSPQAAATLGLPTGLPVVMAPYDIVTTAYGAGAARSGQACVILGTTICAEVLRSSVDRQAPPMGTTLPLDSNLYLRAMPTLTGCEALQWAADTLGVDNIPALEALAASAPETVDRLFFLPYLSPAGERSPFLATQAQGSFHGLTLGATREGIARAVYEGLTFVIRECLQAASDGSPLAEVRVSGGGARSDLWCGMIANALGVPVSRPRDMEVGARGAHLFALFATGECTSIREAVDQHVVASALFLPSAELFPMYDSGFRTFLSLRELARKQWEILGQRL